MSPQWNQQLSRYVLLNVNERLETNWSQKLIEYKTNEQSTKYSNWNMQIQYNQVRLVTAVSASTCLYQISVKLY